MLGGSKPAFSRPFRRLLYDERFTVKLVFVRLPLALESAYNGADNNRLSMELLHVPASR